MSSSSPSTRSRTPGPPAADPRGDDLRGRDDVHRPDDRRPRRPVAAVRPLAVGHRRAVDRQRLPAVARRAVPARRQARRRPRSSAHAHHRRDRFRGRLRAVRRDADLGHRRGVDHLLPHRPGRVRGAALPRRARDRRGRLPAARARQGDGDVLRHHRRPVRRRPAARRLPDRVDVALDLLDQHPRGDHRARAHRAGQARAGAQQRADRLPRRGARRRRDGAHRARPPAVGRLGLGRRPDDRGDRRRAPAARRASSRSSCATRRR